MKSKLFYVFIFIAVTLLIIFSVSSKKRSNAIIASVESQKTAISFHKPVKVTAIHVSAGQHVNKGPLLLEVERPDLIMEQAELLNDQQLIVSERNRLLSDYKSRVNLLEIEIKGKIQRLEADINSLTAEIEIKRSLYNDMISESNVEREKPFARDSDDIQIQSLKDEKILMQKYFLSEKTRFKILLDEDLQSVELRISLVKQRLESLENEHASLTQFAPFSGTIGNVSAQLMELIPSFQTILSVYEERPSTIKAHLNMASGYELTVGQEITVESANREYSTRGEIIEIGARIVSYKDPSAPTTAIQLFGKEIFIKLPEDNTFLYGEQVFVYVQYE